MMNRTRTSATLLPEKKRALLEILDSSARHNKTCPSLVRLSEMLEIATRTTQVLMEELREEKLLSWRIVFCGASAGQVRVVTVAKTGLTTAAPQKFARPPIKKRSDQLKLDHAKAVLMRHFPIVHSAEITEGPTGRGFFIVDRERVTEAEMIRRANEMGA